MCVTSVGKVLEIKGNTAVVDINGKLSEVRIDLVDAKTGDYVYCAAGMAVEKAE
ncbi:MAG: HypC/HybG/HupF family hydrogenase formation chaperone [Candidatus Aenigmarchaeota archaeon]|nr:HypC/HybG/HupF family hydrogenase formation chaperone [Candidatus Aenigmarchaeota archaeon]